MLLRSQLVEAVYAAFGDCDPGITRQSDLIRLSFETARH
jgi:hypothetical protein